MKAAGPSRLLKTAGAFARDRRGAVAIIWGLVIIVVAIGVCFAIDYARASAARQRLQDQLDAATLRAARITGAKDSQVRKAAAEFLNATLKSDRDLIRPQGSWKVGEDSVSGVATAQVEPYFVGLPMGGNFKLRVNTQVRRALSATELALVLDTTGSMAGTKITALKSAADDLVDTLTGQKGADVKIAVIPFGQYVNIGVGRRNEPWANVPADYSQRVTPGCTTITQRTTCQTERYACTRYNDGVPYQTTCTRSINCKTTPVNPPQQHCPAPYTNHYRFQGCIGSPAYPKNVTDNDPSRRYPGFLNLSCGSEITPLTANRGQMKSAIATLQASGETYIPSGLAWGFNALSKVTPLTEAEPYDRAAPNLKPRKVLVLMTDGENTKLMNAGNGRHDVSPASGQRAKQADDYTAELCRNIKAEKIELFTVAFEVNDKTTKDMLETCATDAKHYFDADNPAQLRRAFREIAEALQNLYISR